MYLNNKSLIPYIGINIYRHVRMRYLYAGSSVRVCSAAQNKSARTSPRLPKNTTIMIRTVVLMLIRWPQPSGSRDTKTKDVRQQNIYLHYIFVVQSTESRAAILYGKNEHNITITRSPLSSRAGKDGTFIRILHTASGW